jgi:hypothetical protein
MEHFKGSIVSLCGKIQVRKCPPMSKVLPPAHLPLIFQKLSSFSLQEKLRDLNRHKHILEVSEEFRQVFGSVRGMATLKKAKRT